MLRLFLSLALLLCLAPPAMAGGVETPCSAEDNQYSKDMGYGDANTAYKWGLKIQKALYEKDLTALFAMVEGELSYGPRKAWALRQKFEDVFPPETVDRLLAEPPDCRPVGWRGFLLGHGLIKYQPNATGANITTILQTHAEPITPPPPIGWPYQGQLLSPECFIAPEEEMGETKAPKEGRALNTCPLPPQELEGRDGYVGFKRDYTFMDYKVLASIGIDQCQQLAPARAGKCLTAYLIDWGAFSGGTIGRERLIALYGLFDAPNGEATLRALRFFKNPAHGLNYVIDGIEAP